MPDVFDSNVWVSSLTRPGSNARQLLDSVLMGNLTVVLDAYIYQEVDDAIRAGFQGQDANRFLTHFGQLIYGCPDIMGPQQQAVSQ